MWCGSQICQKRSGATVVRSYFDEGVQEDASRYAYTADHLGSVRELVGADGTTIASRLVFSPFGKLTSEEGSVHSEFGHTGHYYDRSTDLTLSLYRGYDPALGRWLSADPLGLDGGLNLYGYIDNDPVNDVDALGLAPTREELTNLAEWLGVGHTAALINERSAAIDAVARGDMDAAECHARNVADHTTQALGQLAGMAMVRTHGHHSWPKYLGGPKTQQLANISVRRHKAYHKGLDKLYPRWKTKEFYDNMSRSDRQQMLRGLARYTKDFDKRHGTKLYEMMRKNGFPKL